MPGLPIVLSVDDRALGSGLKGMESKVASSSKKAAQTLEKNMAASAGRVNKSIDGIGSKMAGSVSKGMDRLKNSAAIGAVGGFASAGLRSMTDRAIAAGDAAALAGNKLDSVLSASGQTGAAKQLDAMAQAMSKKTGFDDDDIAESSARMITLGASAEATAKIFPKIAAKARLAGKEMGMAATVAGKAFESGNVKGLKRIGIDIDAIGEKSIKAAYKISEAAGQLELLKQLEKNLANVDIGAGVDANVAAKGYYMTQAGNLEEAMGKGASAMRARWQGAAAPALGVLAESPAAGVLGGAMEIGTQLMPVATGLTMLGQAMPALSGIKNVAGTAMDSLRGVKDGLSASGFAATLSGEAHLLAARNITTAAKSVSASSIMNPSSTAGKVGVGLAAVAGIGYGVSETVAGTHNATKMSDAELDAQGPMGKFHRVAGDLYERFNYFGIARRMQSNSLDAQIAEQNRIAAARRARNGYTANIKVTVPNSRTDRAARAY